MRYQVACYNGDGKWDAQYVCLLHWFICLFLLNSFHIQVQVQVNVFEVAFFPRHVPISCLLILIICQLNGNGNLYIIIQISPLVCAIWQIEYLMTMSGNYSWYTYKSAQGIIENFKHFLQYVLFLQLLCNGEKKTTWKRNMKNRDEQKTMPSWVCR